MTLPSEGRKGGNRTVTCVSSISDGDVVGSAMVHHIVVHLSNTATAVKRSVLQEVVKISLTMAEFSRGL